MAVIARTVCGILLFVCLFQYSLSCSHIRTSVGSSVFNEDTGTKVIARTMEYGHRILLEHFEFIVMPRKHVDYPNLIFTSSRAVDRLPVNSSLHISGTIPPSLKIYDPNTELNTYGMVVIGMPFNWPSNSNSPEFKPPTDPTLAKYNIISEGQNEKGLSISLLSFHNSKYQIFEDESCSTCSEKTLLLWMDVVPYILGSCSTGAEAIAKLEEAFIFRPPGIDDYMPVGTGVHWAIDDANGDQYIVEYLNNKLVWHKSDLGIMTNDPDFSWHVQNLDSYANELAGKLVLPKEMQYSPPSNVYPIPRFDAVPHPGVKIGIPGDTSARSRFVKLFFTRELAEMNAPPTTYKEALALASSLINSVSIPYGSQHGVGEKPTDDTSSLLKIPHMWDLLLSEASMTHWTVLKVPQKNLFFYRDYVHTTWKEIDLNKLDFSEGADVKTWKLSNKKEPFAVSYDRFEADNMCHTLG